jgi:aspartate aminotransferase-like enzyme
MLWWQAPRRPSCSPPGLAFAALSDKAWRFVERSTLPKFYFDFKRELKNLTKNQSAYTPASLLVVGLCEALRRIRAEGLEKIFARHALLARATPFGHAGPWALALCPPSLFQCRHGRLGSTRNRWGKSRSHPSGETSFDHCRGAKIRPREESFRIAHMGYIDSSDILMAVGAIELTLKELGYPLELGKGVRAALEVFAQG